MESEQNRPPWWLQVQHYPQNQFWVGTRQTRLDVGSDTSSTMLAATLFYLSGSPKAYEKLCREIRTTFQGETNIRIGAKLTCMDEALRIPPPASGALWREIWPGGIAVDSLALPEGVDVGTGIYSLHHHKE
ncbi:Isotrichodermin C-15 hydroxylase 1 [Colletotrichum chlorophyti]|uniref:Isotrichodermin C-15 hydroxylase 1 n=1 Tax=Colletotrichum chlorophyti TaxID=708187 RepID=A0A1Q8RV44_9PEZI|nr:Isotrichodermin C-15 hydroxylase 1 [Colletotrichum chlorophyti]